MPLQPLLVLLLGETECSYQEDRHLIAGDRRAGTIGPSPATSCNSFRC